MEIILILILALIAGAMLLGKPLNIIITHKYDQPPLPDVSESQKKLDEQQNEIQQKSMNAVIKEIQKLMGVENDGDNA